MSFLIFSAILVYVGITYPEQMLSIVFVIWFFLPAGLANMAPIFAAKLFLVWFLLHPLATFIGYFLKLKDSPI
jgi:hypothetical protein